MSSPDLQTGLLANCVARRVSALAEPEHRKLIWFLQYVSHQPGGLYKAAGEMIALWPERFTTKPMQNLGFEDVRIYNAEEVRQVRDAMRDGRDFPLRGELSDSFYLRSQDWEADCIPRAERER